MNCRQRIVLLFSIGLILCGCSGVAPPSESVWTARPAFRVMDNPLFSARIEPQKGAFPYYAYFLLTLTNRSDAALMIDWNASRYLFNDMPRGVLVFEGIDPSALKTAGVPAEAVAPGEVFSRAIMPLQLIAWSPVKEKTASGRSISPGMLPAGDNGIRLAVRLADRPINIPLSVRISTNGNP